THNGTSGVLARSKTVRDIDGVVSRNVLTRNIGLLEGRSLSRSTDHLLLGWPESLVHLEGQHDGMTESLADDGLARGHDRIEAAHKGLYALAGDDASVQVTRADFGASRASAELLLQYLALLEGGLRYVDTDSTDLVG